MSRILQISTFPTLQPRHGGQRRAHQIGRALERAGHEVHRVAAYTFAGYVGQASEPAVDLGQFPVPQKPTTWLFDGVRAMEQDEAALQAFAALCEAAEPELIVLEEVWLWPVVRNLPAVASGRTPVVYNSYNIEAPQFRRLLLQAGHEQAEALAAEVAALEADLAARTAGCSAVTEEDAAVLRRLGARRVVVAPNGAEHRNRIHLAGALPEALSPEQRYVLYVASAHAPNASGLPDLFLAMLEALRPLERLVVAGGVSHYLGHWLGQEGPAHLARGRLVLFGEVSDFCLDGLFANATGLVLPLRDGGGSNLKTAEALYSGLPLVATTTAMRGFEAYRDMGRVIVADEPADFAAGMRRVFDGTLPRRASGPALDRLRWENTLRSIVALVSEVLAEGVAGPDPQSVSLPSEAT